MRRQRDFRERGLHLSNTVCILTNATVNSRTLIRKGSSTVERYLFTALEASFKVVSATSYRASRRAALIVPRPRWKPSAELHQDASLELLEGHHGHGRDGRERDDLSNNLRLPP